MVIVNFCGFNDGIILVIMVFIIVIIIIGSVWKIVLSNVVRRMIIERLDLMWNFMDVK